MKCVHSHIAVVRSPTCFTSVDTCFFIIKLLWWKSVMIVHQCWLVGFVFVVVVSLSRALPAWPSNTYFCHSRPRMFHCLSFQPIQFLSNWLKFKCISDGIQLYENCSNIDSWHTPNQNSVSNKHPIQIQNIHCSFTSVHVQTNVIMSSVKHGKLWKPKLWKKHIFAERRKQILLSKC